MYRDDLEASHARVDQLQRELRELTAAGAHDRQRIVELTSQLSAMQAALARAQGYRPPGSLDQEFPFAPRSTTILTLGVLSLAVCAVLGPIAWAMGNEELRRIDDGRTSAANRGNVVAGRVCGIIGSALLMLSGLMMLVAVMAAAAA